MERIGADIAGKIGGAGVSKRGMMMLLRLCAIFVLASVSTGAFAQTPKSAGSFKDWQAYTYADKGKKVCYIASAPLESEPKNVRRSDIFFLVTHRTAEKVTDEINLYLGYPIKEKSAVTVEVEGRKFELEIRGENAWTKSAQQDIKLVAAMIKGNEMIVRGTSKRGTRTVDRYSLLGFTAAHKSIDKACGISK